MCDGQMPDKCRVCACIGTGEKKSKNDRFLTVEELQTSGHVAQYNQGK